MQVVRGPAVPDKRAGRRGLNRWRRGDRRDRGRRSWGWRDGLPRAGAEGPADLDLLVLPLPGPIVLVELDVVEAVGAQAVVVDDKGRAVPMRVVERHAGGRFELDGGIIGGTADVVGADLAAEWDVGGAIRRAHGTYVRGGHRRRQAALLGAEDHDQPADSQREDQNQGGSSQLLGPAPHPPE